MRPAVQLHYSWGTEAPAVSAEAPAVSAAAPAEGQAARAASVVESAARVASVEAAWEVGVFSQVLDTECRCVVLAAT
jgi:hypothetical protein